MERFGKQKTQPWKGDRLVPDVDNFPEPADMAKLDIGDEAQGQGAGRAVDLIKDTVPEWRRTMMKMDKTAPLKRKEVARAYNKHVDKTGLALTRESELQVRLDKFSYPPGFASNKSGSDYSDKIKTSFSRYGEIKQQGLYAIVMGCGHGKSTLARRYGVVDVDDLVDARVHSLLVKQRKRAHESNSAEDWAEHNRLWFRLCRRTLSYLDYSKPVVILVHHEEIALEIGAEVIGGMVLTDNALEAMTRERSAIEITVAKDNLRKNREFHDTFRPAVCSSFDMVETHFLNLMSDRSIAVAAPNKHSWRFRNPHYAETCPEYILKGEFVNGMGLMDVVDMYEAKMVPKECVDYYVKQFSLESAYGFGATNNDWVKVMAQAASAVVNPKEFKINVGTDYTDAFPFISDKERNRANITVKRLDKVFNIFSHKDCVRLAEHHHGSRNVFVAGVLTAWKGLFSHTSFSHIIYELLKVQYERWEVVMKGLHNLVRNSSFFLNRKLEEADRQALMYLDLLVGRTDYDITIDEALKGRQSVDTMPDHVAWDSTTATWTKEKYRKLFDQSVHDAYQKMNSQPRRINVTNFMDYYRYRRRWLTKGSLVANNIDSAKKKYVSGLVDEIGGAIEEYQDRHNKGSFFEMHDIIDCMDKRENMFNVTKIMKKFETGFKFRILLPGSLMHYIVFSYVLMVAEKQDQVANVRLNTEADESMMFLDRKLEGGLHHMLYDWADFNAQHSSYEMAAVIRGLENIPTAPRDYGMFVQVIAESMEKMWLMDKEGNLHKLGNGLFSGWRGTTWINTVLNFCYVNVALTCFREIYKTQSIAYADQGGDDVDIAFYEAKDALRFMRIMDAMKFEAKLVKQMIAKKSEFFRITISGGRAFGSPTRALASFIAGNWEGMGRATIRERVAGVLDQVWKIIRRGLKETVGRGLILASLNHWCKVKTNGVDWDDLPKEVIHGAEECGGLGVPDGDGNVWILDTDVPVFKDIGVTKLPPGTLASTDLAHQVMEEVKRFGLVMPKPDLYAKKMAEDQFNYADRSSTAEWEDVFDYTYRVVGKRYVLDGEDDNLHFKEMMRFDERNYDPTMLKIAQTYSEMAGFVTLNGKVLDKAEIVELVSQGRVKYEALEFKGDSHFRRLVPDTWGFRITNYCVEMINRGSLKMAEAETAFRNLCWMVKKEFAHMM